MRTDIDVDNFKKILADQKSECAQRLEQEMNSLRTYSNSDPDMLDAAVDIASRERTVEWISSLKERQNLIEEAFQRIETGQFGVCTKCGQNIGMDRLYEKPYAEYCINCKQKSEHRRK